MADHNELGSRGETLALNYLQKYGYTLLAKNWRFQYKEVDLIVRKADVVVFVEVKSRLPQHHETQRDLITKQKQRHLIEAADHYINTQNLDVEVQFDLIEINFQQQPPEIIHIEEAFGPSF